MSGGTSSTAPSIARKSSTGRGKSLVPKKKPPPIAKGRSKDFFLLDSSIRASNIGAIKVSPPPVDSTVLVSKKKTIPSQDKTSATTYGAAGKTRKSFKIATELVYARAIDFVKNLRREIRIAFVPIVEILHCHETKEFFFEPATDINEPFIVRVEDVDDPVVVSRETIWLLNADIRFKIVLENIMEYCWDHHVAYNFFAQRRRYTRGPDHDLGFLQKTAEKLTPPTVLDATSYILAFNSFETRFIQKTNGRANLLASPLGRPPVPLQASASAPVPSPRYSADSNMYETTSEISTDVEDNSDYSDLDEIPRFQGPDRLQPTGTTPPAEEEEEGHATTEEIVTGAKD